MGWASKRNGELLALAAAEFDVFLPADRNLSHQQDVSAFNIAVVVLVARSNSIDDLRPLIPQVLEVLANAERGRVPLDGGSPTMIYKPSYSHSHALVIGINGCVAASRLAFAVADAKGVSQIMRGYNPAMGWQDRVSVTPAVRNGKPCIKGTRITVYDVLEHLAGGMTEGEILSDFPDLSRSDIRAALAFAAGERRLANSVA